LYKTYLLLVSLFSTLLHAQQAQVIFVHNGLSEGFNSKEAMEIVSNPNGLGVDQQ
jgi:hypothetical protein